LPGHSLLNNQKQSLLMILRIVAFSFFIFHSLSNYAQKNSTIDKKPKIVVGIVIDQMRYDYLFRFWDKYGEDGFKKLLKNGFNCKNTHYNYVPTFTGPGHASIYTGTGPSLHGIIANAWFDKERNKMLYCTEDIQGSSSHGLLMSPKNMLTTSISDELRLFNNFKSKAIGIAIKDRSAILPAGHTANAAYWLDKKSGNWTSSAYYLEEYPTWVKEFNAKNNAFTYLNKEWNTLLPIEAYTESTSDNTPYERGFLENQRPVFPYSIPDLVKTLGAELIASTPFGNDFTKDFTIRAIESEKLGKGKYTDFLSVSFSSPDYIGHQFGPQSIEIQDNYLRLDKTMAELLHFLEKEFGKENFLLFLTADHGGAHNPSFMIDNKMNAGYFDSKKVVSELKTKLAKQYGEGDWITNYSNQQFFLNHQLIQDKQLNLYQVQNQISEYLLKAEGVANAYSAHSLLNGGASVFPGDLIKNGLNQKRSGDVIISLEPGWMENSHTGTTHGAVYTYDTHVPLIWYGWNIQQGSSARAVEITDIAPTISTLLNIPFPNGCVGKSLEDLISK
jgi:predicted AlkP superfamily pyrophosphatase or phosphodiesterase